MRYSEDYFVQMVMEDADNRFEIFGQLQKERKNLGISLEDVAYRLGISLKEIEDIEAGRLDPSLSLIQRYARILNLKASFSLDKSSD